MKQSELFHPRVFDDRNWAEGYFRRNKFSIAKVGERLARLLKATGFSKGSILDVGCGFATVPIKFAQAFPEAQITGIELGEPLLEIGREQVKREGLEHQITLQKGDAMAVGFEDNSFDVVLNTFLLHIVEDPVLMLNEIQRVARPEGNIIITDLRRGFLAYMVKKFRTAHTLEEATGIISKSGLREGTMSKGPFWWDFTSLNHCV